MKEKPALLKGVLIILIAITTTLILLHSSWTAEPVEEPDRTDWPPVSSEGMCLVDSTRVMFENKTGYASANEFRMFRLNDSWNSDGRIIFAPGDDITICENEDDRTGKCISPVFGFTVQCTPCLLVTNNHLLVDEKNKCLGQTEREYMYHCTQRYC